MKYGFLKENSRKSFCIPVSDKGVNLSKNPDDLADGQLKSCKNVWNRNGRLETRAGLYTDCEKIVANAEMDNQLSHTYRLTDTVVFYDGEYMRILTDEISYDESHYFVCVYLTGNDGKIIHIGNMLFSRVASDTFYIPANITFYMGAKQNGGGIFALISLINSENFSEKIYDIYEINEDLDSWERCINYYIPTVYINGRGNAYETAKMYNSANTASPMELEPLNLLDGSFYAYFSSDRYSSSFRLPFSQLADESVICRIYRNSEIYTEWIVSKGSNSCVCTLGEDTVEMRVDREKGIISFFSNYSNYAIPQMYDYTENNIRILAKKNIPDSFSKVVSCKLSTAVDSRTIFAGGTEGNKVYYASYHNPLYFPQIENNGVGGADNEITAIVPIKNRIIAFKKSEIFSIEIKKGRQLNQTTLLADNPNVFFSNDSYNIKCIERNIGCIYKSSAAVSGSGVIWLANNGNVYSLYNDTLYELSGNVRSHLNELEPEEDIVPVAAAWNNNYILCFGSKAVIMQYSSKGLRNNSEDAAWYIWEFPFDCKVIGAFSHKEKPGLICINRMETICFFAELIGKDDRIIKLTNGTKEVISEKTESAIETKCYCPIELDKAVRIKKICAKIKAEGNILLAVESDNEYCEFALSEADMRCNENDIIRLKTDIKCSDSFCIKLKSSEPFSLGRVEVYYTEINN